MHFSTDLRVTLSPYPHIFQIATTNKRLNGHEESIYEFGKYLFLFIVEFQLHTIHKHFVSLLLGQFLQSFLVSEMVSIMQFLDIFLVHGNTLSEHLDLLIYLNELLKRELK